MSREDPQLKIRLPNDLKKKLELKAAQNKRSLNAEVVDCLETALNLDLSTKFDADKLISSIMSKAIKYSTRKAAIELLKTDEKSLIDKLDSISKNKKDAAIKAIIEIINLF